MPASQRTIVGATFDQEFFIDPSNASSENDLGGLGVAEVHRVTIDATDNPGEDVEVRFYNNATPTVGTTAAHMWLPCRKGEITKYVMDRGIAFSTAISVATVQNKGGETGATTPSGRVTVRVAVLDA